MLHTLSRRALVGEINFSVEVLENELLVFA